VGGCFFFLLNASFSGNTHLGGEDLDNILVKHCVSEFQRQHRGISLENNARAIRRLRTACERAKRALSASSTATVEVDALAGTIFFFLFCIYL
jgi:L1 cell adhesion molecule like protein